MIDMIMYGKAPTLISGVQKSAPSLAMTRSHESANPSPPATHVAVGGAQRRLAEPRHQPEELEEEVGSEVLGDRRGVGAEAAEVGAGAERPCRRRSAPAPAPASSSRTRATASTSCASISPESRLRFSGSFSVTVATPSSTVVEDELLGHRRPP